MERAEAILQRAAAAAAAEGRAAGSGSADGAAAASGGGEPCTPQRHSGHDSSWNESPLGTSGLDYGEVESPGECPVCSRVRGEWQVAAQARRCVAQGCMDLPLAHSICLMSTNS